MLFLRSLIYFLGSTLALSVLVAIALVLFFTPIKVRYPILSKWSLFCLWWLRITLNIKLNVIGQENIPNIACVIISNHQSTWETLALQTIFPHQTWVLKQELQWIPIFGWGLSLLKPIIINRVKNLKHSKKFLNKVLLEFLKAFLWWCSLKVHVSLTVNLANTKKAVLRLLKKPVVIFHRSIIMLANFGPKVALLNNQALLPW